jgi:glycerol-3-phosphate cytidylyltransferase-like family protein
MTEPTRVYVDMVGDLFHPGHVALLRAADRPTADFLAEHDLALVVHGDDLGDEAAAELYGPAVATGRLRLVPYTEGVSTTDLIARVRSRSR